MLSGTATWTTGLLVGLSAAVAAQSSTGATQKDPAARSAPHERMAFFEGTWELEPGGKPASIARQAGRRETCSWLAGERRHLVCRTFHESAQGRRESIYILSYSEHDAKYVAWFAFPEGQNLLYHGTVDQDRWTMEMQPTRMIPSGLRLRTIVTPTDTGIRFVEEGSKDGGPWEVGEDYRHKRVTGDQPSRAAAADSLPATTTNPSAVSPPHERMAIFEGTWEFATATTPEVIARRSGRRESCEWLSGARRHIVCLQRSKSATGLDQESMYILSYRESDSTYIAHFATPEGHNVVFHGTPSDDGWVMDLQPTPLVPGNMRIRTRITRAGNELHFVDERSTDGGPWQIIEDYRHRRIR